MIQMEDIMTTDTNVSQFITYNLFNISDSAFHRLDASKYIKNAKEINAITIVSRKTAVTDDLSFLAQACSKHINPFFEKHGLTDHVLWLFAVHGPWQPKTRIIKYKKLWKSNPQFKPFVHLAKKSDEIEIESDKGLRYAGMVKLKNDSLSQAVELLRNDSACCIIASDRPEISSSNSINDLISLAFPNDKHGFKSTSINWLNLAAYLCSKRDFVIRVFGSFDDRDATIDIMFKKWLFEFKGISKEEV